MKNTLLITASIAALVAGIGLASAQGLNERRDAPAAATSEQKAPEGQTDHQKSALPAKTEKPKSPATAQVPEKNDKMKPAATAQEPGKEKSAPTAQAPEKAKPATTAQAPENTEFRTPDRRTVSEPRRCARCGNTKGLTAEGGGILGLRADVGRAEPKIPGDLEGREG